MDKKYTVLKADGTPLPEDEPCLVIRGKDALFLSMVRFYYNEYTDCADVPEEQVEKVYSELYALEKEAEEWQKKNQDLVKWAD